MKRLLIILFAFSLIYAEPSKYTVYFMGMPVVGVEMNENHVEFNGKDAVLFEFGAKALSIVYYLYPVDNYYNTMLYKDHHELISFSKEINQYGFIQNITAESQNSMMYYNADLYFDVTYHNIFSLLYAIKNNKVDKLLTHDFVLEAEGTFHKARLSIASEKDNIVKYSINLMETLEDNQFLEKTDVFLENVFRDNAERYIWVDVDKNEIVRCKFKVGFISLNAYIEE